MHFEQCGRPHVTKIAIPPPLKEHSLWTSPEIIRFISHSLTLCPLNPKRAETWDLPRAASYLLSVRWSLYVEGIIKRRDNIHSRRRDVQQMGFVHKEYKPLRSFWEVKRAWSLQQRSGAFSLLSSHTNHLTTSNTTNFCLNSRWQQTYQLLLTKLLTAATIRPEQVSWNADRYGITWMYLRYMFWHVKKANLI